MTIKENQELINSKDWEMLATKNFLYHMSDDKSSLNYVISADLVENFFLDERILSIAITNSRNYFSGNFVPTNTRYNVFKNLLGLMSLQGVDLSIESWKKWVKLFLEKRIFVNSSKIMVIIGIENKGPNFARMLISDKKTYYELVRINNGNNLYSNQFTPDLIEGLTDEELYKLGKRITYLNNLNITTRYPNDLLKLYPTKQDLIDFSCKGKFSSKALKCGYAFSSLSVQEFEILYTKNKKSDMSQEGIDHNRYLLDSFAPYYSMNQNVPISDEFLEDYINKNGTTGNMRLIINNISKDQFKKFNDKISVGNMAKSYKLNLDEVTELKGPVNIDISSVRCFTLDEIAKNPHFFDPSTLAFKPYQYVTKDVWKLLNNSWFRINGIRKRYNKNCMEFDKVIMAGLPERLNLKILKYYKEVMNVSNSEFLNVFKKIKITSNSSRDLIRIGFMSQIVDMF